LGGAKFFQKAAFRPQMVLGLGISCGILKKQKATGTPRDGALVGLSQIPWTTLVMVFGTLLFLL
jgi:hypothetical protein